MNKQCLLPFSVHAPEGLFLFGWTPSVQSPSNFQRPLIEAFNENENAKPDRKQESLVNLNWNPVSPEVLLQLHNKPLEWCFNS